MTTYIDPPARGGPSWPTPLYELTLAVAEARRPADIFEPALTCLHDSLGVERASLLLFDAAGVMRFRAWRNLSDTYRAAVDGHSPWSRTDTNAQPILVEDVRNDPSLDDLRPTVEAEGIRALAFIPLALGPKLLGKFMLYYDEPHAFDEAEILTARTVAAHVAFAIDQHAHRESVSRYRSLADTLPALVAITGPDGEIEDIDEGYREYSGLTLEQARDWRKYTMIHPDDFNDAMDRWAEALRTGEPLQNEMRLRRRDGVYRWHLMQAKPITDADGAVQRWVTVSVDIEDRKRAEARDRYLAQTTAQLVSPLDSADLLAEIARLAVPALADVCAIGLFDGTNRTMRIETALTHAPDRTLVDAIHLREWREAPGATTTVGDAISTGRTVHVPDFSEEWIRACARGHGQVDAALALAPGSLICVPLLARGETRGMATFAVNRSGRTYDPDDVALIEEAASRLSIALENRQLYEDLLRTADQLARANQAKDEFLGLVSHELKTPITTILGNAEVLDKRSDALDEASRTAALTDIRTEAERLHRIIDNLLVLARLEQGQTLDREPVLVERIVRAVAETHRRAHPHRELIVQWHAGSVPVLASTAYLEQTLRNLLGNAEKYSPPDAPIEIEGHTDGDSITVRVLDRGHGIDPEEAPSLFMPFYRSRATSTLAPGVGIGLAVCKRLIEAQDGRIWAACRLDAPGSEFAFALPTLTEPD